MISHETVTALNYRTAVSAGSDFSRLMKFPEVYHAHGITTPPFSGGERPVTGQGRDTIYSVTVSGNTATSCVAGPLRAGGAEADPEQPFFGSQMTK